MSQNEQSKGGRRDESKEKRAFAGLAVGILLYFPSCKTTMFGSAIFYPAMLENEEKNKIKLLLLDQYDVCFGP
jgi:hypothetical protein